MNVIVRRPPSRPAALPRAMARDLLGGAGHAPSPVTYHTMLSSLETRGPLSLCDSTAPAGTLVASHRHPAEDEIVVVLSGEIEIRMGGRVLLRTAGGTAFIPRGTEHQIRVLTQARTIAMLTRDSLEVPAAA